MSLLTLPPEMVLRIAESSTSRDINALLRCSRFFHRLLNGFLYRRDLCDGQRAANWAVANNSSLPLQAQNRFGISLKDCGIEVLHEAAREGACVLIDYVLDSGQIDIDSWSLKRMTRGFTSLSLAVVSGRANAVRLLLDRGANPSAVNCEINECSSLILALLHHQDDIARMLLAAGADTHRVELGMSPVSWAARLRKFDMVTTLINAGANVVSFSVDGESLLGVSIMHPADSSLVELILSRGGLTPSDDKDSYLQRVAHYGWYNVAKMLIERGANVPPADFNQLLMGIIHQNNYSLAELLIQHCAAGINTRGPDEIPVLFYTCFEEHISLCKSLLDAGADVSDSVEGGYQPLSIATCPAIAKLLIENGADYEHASNGNYTPLMISIARGDLDVTKVLLEAGANPCGTPCDVQGADFIELLLDHGADITANNSIDITPLYYAAALGHSLIVETLLNHGADGEKGAKRGYTPLMGAVRFGYRDAAETLLRHGVSLETTNFAGETALLVAAQTPKVDVTDVLDVLDVLLSRGANIQATDLQGNNALIIASAEPDNETTIQRLLRDNLVDIDAQNTFGRTALLRAAMRGQAEIVQCLLAHKPPADATIKDHWGATPLSMAVRHGHSHVVEMLLAHNYRQSNLYDKDGHGRTIFDWARRTDNGDVRRMLLSLPEAAGMDLDNDTEASMLHFDCSTCSCDICGRCSVCDMGKVQVCSTCGEGGVYRVCVCKFCLEDGVGCANGHDGLEEIYCTCPRAEKYNKSEDFPSGEEAKESNDEGNGIEDDMDED